MTEWLCSNCTLLEQLQVTTPIIIVAASLLFILLERWFPYNKGQRVFRSGFWVDLIGYGLIQSYLLALLLSEFIYWLDHSTGASRFRLVSDWPLWAQVVFFIILHDLVTYTIHRWQHRSPFLWRFHEAHHSTEYVDWLSGIRSHSLEICLYQSAEYIPVILLGASPEVPLIKSIFNSTYGMYIHANLNWRMGPLLYLLNGPELHRWHHAQDTPEAYDTNFATKFSLWDYLFGTIYESKETATRYGSDVEGFPKGWVSQHLFAFRGLIKIPKLRRVQSPPKSSDEAVAKG